MEQSRKNTSIFVTSAAGQLGCGTIHHLVSHLPDLKVVGSVRNPEKAKEKFSNLANNANFRLVVTPNVTEEEGLSALVDAMRGCEALFLIPPNQGRVEVGKAYTRAAKEAGIKYILLLSISAIGKRDVLFAREFGEIEDCIRASWIRASFLRAGFFTDNLLADAATVKRGKEFYHLADPDARFNPITVLDISLLASSLLTKYLGPKEGGLQQHQGHNPDIYYLSGPQPITMTEVAKIFSKVIPASFSFALLVVKSEILASKQIIKDDVKYIQYTRKDYLKSLVRPGKPESMAQGLIELWDMVNDGLDATVSPDFEKIVGRKPASVESFLTSHSQLFV